MIRYQVVVLRVPFDPDGDESTSGEDTPDNWNWTAVIDAPELVECVAWGPVEGTVEPSVEEAG